MGMVLNDNDNALEHKMVMIMRIMNDNGGDNDNDDGG